MPPSHYQQVVAGGNFRDMFESVNARSCRTDSKFKAFSQLPGTLGQAARRVNVNQKVCDREFAVAVDHRRLFD
jgi:hypothetical protein